MGRRNRNRKPLFTEVTILDTAAEGKSLAKVDDKVLFVPQTVPGDVIDVQVTKKRKSYMEGRVVKFHSYSENRVEPFCEHFVYLLVGLYS